MNYNLPEQLETELQAQAKEFGLAPQDYLNAIVRERVIELKGFYPPDEVIAAQIAADPDLPPLRTWEEMKREFKLCQPFPREE